MIYGRANKATCRLILSLLLLSPGVLDEPSSFDNAFMTLFELAIRDVILVSLPVLEWHHLGSEIKLT